MGNVKAFFKHIILIIIFSLFTSFCTYIGLNSTYKHINTENIPNGINVDIAQSNSVSGRIYGTVTSTDQNDLNGKYMKVYIFNKNGVLKGIKFLELNNLELNKPRRFEVNFKANNVRYYAIEIVENSEETQKDILDSLKLFKDVFTDERVKFWLVITLLIYALFG